MAATRLEDILLAYAPGVTSFGDQAYPLEAVGGGDTYDEDFTSSLRDFVAARSAAEKNIDSDPTLVGGWFGGAGADPSAIILEADWLNPPEEDDDDAEGGEEEVVDSPLSSDDDDATPSLPSLIYKKTNAVTVDDDYWSPNSYHATRATTPENPQLRLLSETPIGAISSIAMLGPYAYTHTLEAGDAVNVFRRGAFGGRVEASVKLLSKKPVKYMRACPVSNCVYIVQFVHKLYLITRIDEAFKVAKWETADNRPVAHPPYFSAGGDIIFEANEKLFVYAANGDLLRKIAVKKTFADMFRPVGVGVLQKSNGNIILTYINNDNYRATLLEIDTDGNEARKCQSLNSEECAIDFADEHGNIIVINPTEGIEVLDPYLNSLGVLDFPHCGVVLLLDMHYEPATQEIILIILEKGKKKNNHILLTCQYK